MGVAESKIPQRYLDSLNHVTFYEGVECVFGFIDKFFHVARDDLNHVPTEGLRLKTSENSLGICYGDLDVDKV